MSNLIAIGQTYDKMATVSSFAISPDGYSWATSNSTSQPFLPFVPRLSGIGISWTRNLPWTIRSLGIYPNLNSVIWVNNVFIAVGDNGTIISSYNANDWQILDSPVIQNLNSIASNGTTYVAVGDNGIVIVSTNGINWGLGSSGLFSQLLSVTWSSDLNLFVAIGINGIIITSSDGYSWNTQISGTSCQLNGIACIPSGWDVGEWNNSLPPWSYSYLIAVGENGIILTSIDGISWIMQNSPVTTALNGVNWDGYGVIAVGDNGISISSDDAITWVIDATGITTNLNAICTGQFVNILVGDSGTVLRDTMITSTNQDITQFSLQLNNITYSLYMNLFVAVGQSGFIISGTIEYPTQTFTAISDSGYISSSFDGNIWSNGSIIQANFSPRAIDQAVDASGLNSVVIIAGSQKYGADEPSHNRLDEVAQIFVSSAALGTISVDNPGFEDSWTMVYAEDSTNSIYHGVRHITPEPVTISMSLSSNASVTNTVTINITNNTNLIGLVDLLSSNTIENVGTVIFSTNPNTSYELLSVDITDTTWTFKFVGEATYDITDTVTFTYTHPTVWIVCGKSYNNPVLLYSLDDGESWNRVDIPDLYNGRALFDITYTNNQFYISGYEVVLYTYSIINPTWNSTNFVTSPYGSANFIKIASNPSGHIVAASSGLLYYSLDGAVWKSYYQPGYQFTSIIWYIDHWVAGVSSLLTTYTYFTSTDTLNWIGRNNTVQMYDFYITP